MLSILGFGMTRFLSRELSRVGGQNLIQSKSKDCHAIRYRRSSYLPAHRINLAVLENERIV